MDFYVYLQGQSPATHAPKHRTTRKLCKLLLAAALAEQVGTAAIRLTTDMHFHDVKAMARAMANFPVYYGTPYPVNEMCLDEGFQRCMRYPLLLGRDQRSCVGQ